MKESLIVTLVTIVMATLGEMPGKGTACLGSSVTFLAALDQQARSDGNKMITLGTGVWHL